MAGGLSSGNLANVRVLAVDLDGVVYQGKTMLSGADEAIHRLRQNGLKVFFTTNSSGKTRADIARKLANMGIPAVEDDVLTSAYTAGCLIRGMGGNPRVLVIGMEGLKEEITRAGADIVMGLPCDFVVVGLDTAFSYDKIHLSMEAIRGGATFVACNRDVSFPGDQGRMFPGCGPIVAAVEAAVGFPPQYLAGKPNVLMLDIIAACCHAGPDEILVVGDSVESDIGMAIAFGSPSVLVGAKASQSGAGTLRSFYRIESLAELPRMVEGRT